MDDYWGCCALQGSEVRAPKISNLDQAVPCWLFCQFCGDLIAQQRIPGLKYQPLGFSEWWWLSRRGERIQQKPAGQVTGVIKMQKSAAVITGRWQNLLLNRHATNFLIHHECSPYRRAIANPRLAGCLKRRAVINLSLGQGLKACAHGHASIAALRRNIFPLTRRLPCAGSCCMRLVGKQTQACLQANAACVRCRHRQACPTVQGL